MLAVAVLLPACGGGDPADPDDGASAVVTQDDVRYTASTEVMESFPVQLRTTVTVANIGSTSVELTFPDGCIVLMAAGRAGSDEHVWEQARMCTTALVHVRLAPGEEREFNTGTVSARDVLGSQLPDGPYDIRAVLRPLSGIVVVPAGRVELAAPRGE
jgi:hypothetical protein